MVVFDVIGVGIVMLILFGLLCLFVVIGSIDIYYGVLFVLYVFVQFLCVLLFGVLSDCFGCCLVLFVLFVGVVLDYLLMVFVLMFVWFYVGWLIVGVIGVNVVVVIVYVIDVMVEFDCVWCFGQFGVMMGIGFIVGLLIGGLFGVLYLCVLFVVAVLFNVLNFVFVWCVLLELWLCLVGGGYMVGVFNLFVNLCWLSGVFVFVLLVGIYVIVVFVLQVFVMLWILYGQEYFGWLMLVVGLLFVGYGVCYVFVQVFVIGLLIVWFGE